MNNTIIFIIIMLISCCFSSSIGVGSYFIFLSPSPVKKQIKKQEIEEQEIEEQEIEEQEIEEFVKDTNTNTPLNDSGDGDVIYLDRHRVTCGSNGINNFKLTNDNGKYKYNFACTKGGNLGDTIRKVTPFNEIPVKGNTTQVNYLDRHLVDCGTGSILSEFALINNGSSALPRQFAYEYKCTKSTDPLKCRDVVTDYTQNDGGKTSALYNHDIKCNSDEAISQFKLLSQTPSNNVAYSYKCCKY